MTAPITVFLESRFEIGHDGRWRTILPSEAGAGWADAVDGAPARLAARATQGDAAPLVVDGEAVALPTYVGVRGAVRALPTLVAAIDAAVRDSRAISVKLPGIIGVLAVRSARRARVPVIAHVVGDIDDVLRAGVAGPAGRLAAPVARRLVAAAVRGADLVRFVTERSLQRRYPPSPTATTMAFSDVEALPTAASARTSRSHGPPTIVAVGSQEQRYKGHDVLIRAVAAARARARLGDVELRLLGAGRLQPELRALAQELGVADSVHFVGHVSDRDELVAIVADADVFALPSRTEGMPRALIEAMALGVPCVGARVGGIPELLPQEALVPPDDVGALADALARVLLDPAEAARRSQLGVARAADFSAPAQAERRARWRALVRDLVDGAS